jgi:hypothetical protein
MLVTATEELRKFVGSRGGTVWVWCRGTFGLRGVTVLVTDVAPPGSDAGFELFVVDDILVAVRLPLHLRPDVLDVSMEGRCRRRPVATWDGCVFIL